ncbi:F-box protein CPR1-like [Silene latifolia]|uniref:F-box protein CPR1-like n=1 Tax=Silene latifolia TaxID=37657 RepID=UPI003D77EECA
MDYYHKNIRQLEGNLLILFITKRSNEINQFYTLSPGNGNNIVDTDPLEYYLGKRSERYETESVSLLGSCNGLVAILYDNKLILWNPLTKKQSFIRVVKNGVLDVEDSYGHGYLFGLCYDSSKDEYVMIVGFEYKIPPGSNYGADVGYGRKGCMKVYFYNFKHDSERVRIIATEFKYMYRKLYAGDVGKVIRGVPHWIIQYMDPNTSLKNDIIYLDLNEEKFKKMARPDESRDKRLLGLATLDGENQLGCVLRDIACANLEVWVMKEYGNSESWSNVFTFPYMNMVDDRRLMLSNPSDIDVLGFMPSGELLVNLNGRELRVYDIDKGKSMEMKPQGIYSDFVIVCEPRLISPPEPQIGVRQKQKLKM